MKRFSVSGMATAVTGELRGRASARWWPVEKAKDLGRPGGIATPLQHGDRALDRYARIAVAFSDESASIERLGGS